MESSSGQTGRYLRGSAGFRNLLKLVAIGILCTPIAAAQSFAVRNPNRQKWPQAEAEKIYKFAAQLVESEFKPRQPVRPRFTLVLGYEKDQLDVNTSELRLRKWDRRMFTEGVILFGFEQMLPADAKKRLVDRALKESDAVLTVDQARAASCQGTVRGADCVESTPAKLSTETGK